MTVTCVPLLAAVNLSSRSEGGAVLVSAGYCNAAHCRQHVNGPLVIKNPNHLVINIELVGPRV